MKIVERPLAELFGIKAPPHLTVPVKVWDDGEELGKHVPRLDPTYRFPAALIRDFNVWSKFNLTTMLLFGPTGSGKSSFVRQLANRLGIPLYPMTMHKHTELAEVFGYMGIGPEGTHLLDGPVTKAARAGAWLLIDEIGRADPAIAVGLNGLKDGSFVIPTTGELIVPAEGFRAFYTDNTNLCGDDTGGYNTASVQDISVPDRVDMAIYVPYPEDSERTELRALLDQYMDDESLAYWLDQEGVTVETEQGNKSGADVSRDDFIDAICKVRDMVRAQSLDGGNDSPDALERPMSFRSLTRWVKYCVGFCNAAEQYKSAIHYALARAMTNCCTPTAKVAIHAIVTSVFGIEEELPQPDASQATV